MVASSSAEFLSSISPSGRPLTNNTDVGPSLVLVLHKGELVDRQPVVVRPLVEIDHPGLRAAYRSVIGVVLDGYAVHDHAVKGPIAGLQHRTFRASQSAEGILQRSGGKVRVEPCKCITQAKRQHNLAIICALRAQRIGSDVRAVGGLPAETLQPGEGDLLYVGLGDGNQDYSSRETTIGERVVRSTTAKPI